VGDPIEVRLFEQTNWSFDEELQSQELVLAIFKAPHNTASFFEKYKGLEIVEQLHQSKI